MDSSTLHLLGRYNEVPIAMFDDPPLAIDGKPTTLEGGDAARLRNGFILFVRRPFIVIGEIPFNEPEKFREYTEWLAERHSLVCVPYNPQRLELPAVEFRSLPTDALVEMEST